MIYSGPLSETLKSCMLQELLVIDDLLFAMVGIEGKYVRVRRGRYKEGNSFYFQLEPSLDAPLHVSTPVEFFILIQAVLHLFHKI